MEPENNLDYLVKSVSQLQDALDALDALYKKEYEECLILEAKLALLESRIKEIERIAFLVSI